MDGPFSKYISVHFFTAHFESANGISGQGCAMVIEKSF